MIRSAYECFASFPYPAHQMSSYAPTQISGTLVGDGSCYGDVNALLLFQE